MPFLLTRRPAPQAEGDPEQSDEASRLWRQVQARERQSQAPARVLVVVAAVFGAAVLLVGLWIVVFQ